jgi:hypothetical protein
MKRLAPFACLILLAASLFAYDFPSAGFAPSGTQSIDGRTYTKLTDPSGGVLLFASEAEPDDARMAALKSVAASLRSWKSMQPAQIRAINFANTLQVIVLPASFQSDGVDLAPAVPTGIQFFYNGTTTYDFKVKSGQYIVRVRGLYTGEDDLLAQTLAAFKNPAAFAEAADPVALLKRIAALEARAAGDEARIKTLEKRSEREETALMAALNGGTPVNPAAIARLSELRRNDPTLSKEKAAAQLGAENLVIKPSELDIAFFVLFGQR